MLGDGVEEAAEGEREIGLPHGADVSSAVFHEGSVQASLSWLAGERVCTDASHFQRKSQNAADKA